MEAFLSRTPVFLTMLAGVVLATLGLLVLFPAVALLPVVAAILVWVLAKVPVRYPVFTLLALMLIVDCAVEVPYSGHWKSPFCPRRRPIACGSAGRSLPMLSNAKPSATTPPATTTTTPPAP